MTYYKVCPNCGANLDPGEKCDCDCGALHSDNKKIKKGEKKDGQLQPIRYSRRDRRK